MIINIKHRFMDRSLVVGSLMLLLVGCTGGSGDSGGSNIGGAPTDTDITYDGPAPQTDDVQAFRLNVWDNLVADNRCGACHGTGGQVPTFVRSDDINQAYNSANTIVDLSTPSASRLVTKVAGGHNCWLDNDSICGDILTGYIEDWATSSGSAGNVVVLTAPSERVVGESKSFPDDSGDFENTVYELLAQPNGYCYQCHREDAGTPQQPYFASSDVDAAYEAVKSKIDLDNPANSRLVLRLRDEFHNCWSDCDGNAQAMEDAITEFADSIPLTAVDPALLTSRALTLLDGVVASSGGRVETNAIALYEFKAGSGLTAFDTSGVDPAINLNLSGDVEWLGAWGLRINDGKAQASTSASAKLHDLITATGEYSIEAWVVPENVTQDDSARIVSYSGGTVVRNFTLGQTLYNYDFLNRSSVTSANGEPGLSTPDDDEVLQATLQHVVATYSAVSGRSIYVNGELVSQQDAVGGGTLGDWDDSFALVVGNEVSNDRLWKGSVRLLAIHNRALAEADIVTNFEAGVGEKFFLLFGVEHLIDVPQSYIVVEVQQFDDYGYLFNEPKFISLDANAQPGNVVIKGMRIGINGGEASIGQAYANIDTVVTDDSYSLEGQLLSNLGTVIALEKGPGNDEFFLTFDQLGDNTYVRVEALPTVVSDPADLEPQSRIGLRTFGQINEALAAITGIPSSDSDVSDTFALVQQQLPTLADINGFLAAHQMAITQLSVSYCSALVDNTVQRSSFFPGFDFDAAPAAVFSVDGRAQVIDPLLERLAAHTLPAPASASLSTQPDPSEITLELNNLIDRIAVCTGCSIDTPTTVKAVCSAAAGNAVMLLQ